MSPEGSRNRHARRPSGTTNRLVLALLRSPLYRLLGGGLCELSYPGRRTGRRISLPVLYAADGERVVVIVGDAQDKRWWRNFTEPGPIEVRMGSHTRAGTARIVPPRDPVYPSAWQLYAERHRIAQQPTDQLLLIDLSSSI